jgi:hypothetical protein
MYLIPVDAGEDAAMSMKQIGMRLPAGNRYRRMLLPEATARYMPWASMAVERHGPSFASISRTNVRSGAE